MLTCLLKTSWGLSAGVAPRGLGFKVLGLKGLGLYSPRRVPYSFCVEHNFQLKRLQSMRDLYEARGVVLLGMILPDPLL